jgi:hypothetical protein
MRDDLSRLVGLEGFEVKRVIDRLDLEVELVARAGCCPRCGRGSVDVKDRPVVRVRDLPIAGRVTQLVWRKRHYRCRGCGRTFTESHPELPARQRVTRRFRRRLFERVRAGAAHAEVARCERTTRYQVARAFRASAGDELEQVARRLGLNVNEDATAQDGQWPAPAANAQGHRRDAKIKARSAACTREESGGGAPAERSAATKQRRAARASRRSGDGGRPGSNRASRREEDILRLAKERPGITVRQIAKEIGVDPTGLYPPMHKLEQEGAISKQGAGLQPAGADGVT